LVLKPDEQGYIMNSTYSEDVEMRDVQEEEDEEGEVDAELDPDEGELRLFEPSIYMLKVYHRGKRF
jgi:hypothetical protein